MLNLIGPEQVRRGIAEVTDGLVFCLSLPLDRPAAGLSAHRFPPIVRPTIRAGHVNAHCDMSVALPGASDIVSDDLVVLHTQFSTQWDAFGHIGARFDADGDGHDEIVYYNGYRAGEDFWATADLGRAGLASLSDVSGAAGGGASSLNAGPVGISHMAVHGVQGRAVLVDLEAHLGRTDRVVGFADLRAVMNADGVSLESGDMLLLHTGFARELMDPAFAGKRPFGATLDGADTALHAWLRDSGIAGIAADNFAVEAFPPAGRRAGQPVLPLHEACLFRLGIHLGELWWLSDLADHLRKVGRTACLLTAPPLRLPGATGSPVTPIATT
jgi:kynurenine formamidase